MLPRLKKSYERQDGNIGLLKAMLFIIGIMECYKAIKFAKNAERRILPIQLLAKIAANISSFITSLKRTARGFSTAGRFLSTRPFAAALLPSLHLGKNSATNNDSRSRHNHKETQNLAGRNVQQRSVLAD